MTKTFDAPEVVAWAGLLIGLGIVMTAALYVVLASDAGRLRRALGLGGVVVVAFGSLSVLMRPVNAEGASPYVDGIVSVNCRLTAVHSAFTGQRPGVQECRTNGLWVVGSVLIVGPVLMGLVAYGAQRRRHDRVPASTGDGELTDV